MGLRSGDGVILIAYGTAPKEVWLIKVELREGAHGVLIDKDA